MSRGRTTIATHLIFTGYGHWVANDIRGSNSVTLHDPKFEELGGIHHGRKSVQPGRPELREFYHHVDPLLKHERLWFGEPLRNALAAAFGQTVRKRGYTCWACGVCSNHAHLIIRAHRDRGEAMWQHFAADSRDALCAAEVIAADHPLWAEDPYRRYISSVPWLRDRIGYVEANPTKEGLPRQVWSFVTPYDGWPFHKHQPRP